MEDQKINLVVCSTLNQITNYLVIEHNRPKKIFNITFDETAQKCLNKNIKIKEWDTQLLNACKYMGYEEFTNINLSEENMYAAKDILERINDVVEKINEPIYWHITGGQRTIALAISQLKNYENRKNDKLLYIEGNTEKLILSDINGELINSDILYGCSDLSLQKVLNLAGFTTTEPKSTIKFKEKGKINDTYEFKKEHDFYKELYNLMCSENLQAIENKDIVEFRNSLLKSNNIKNTTKGKNCKENPSERTKYVQNLFRELLEKNKCLKEKEYNIKESHEIYGSYPAGYIFEKLTAHKINDLIKNNNKIVEMQTSTKTYFEDENKYKMCGTSSIIDELDIVLLTDTGKIINFECKSGSMDGNNAKSHNYTTYRLAGVFGMPILLSPLYKNEKLNENLMKDENLKKQFEALKAAESAELEVWGIDEIERELNKLLNKSK